MPPRPVPIYVGYLRCSLATKQKIEQVHKLEFADVRGAVEGTIGLYGRYAPDKRGVMRFVAKVRISGQQCLVALYPLEDEPDEYWLGTAHPVAG